MEAQLGLNPVNPTNIAGNGLVADVTGVA